MLKPGLYKLIFGLDIFVDCIIDNIEHV